MKDKIIGKSGKLNSWLQRNLENCDVREYVLDATSHIKEDLTLIQRCVVIRDDLISVNCECGKILKFSPGLPYKFSSYCGDKSCKPKRISPPRSCEARKNISFALRKVDEHGLTSAERGAKKAWVTRKKNGYIVNSDHLHTPEVWLKIGESLRSSEKLKAATRRRVERERGTAAVENRTAKTRATRIARGDWLDKIDDEFESYKKQVRRITSSQNLKSLQNFDKRGRTKDGYHLDHIISKFTGFKLGIPPTVIGNIRNLRFLSSSKNCSKQGRNTLEEVQLIINSFFN